MQRNTFLKKDFSELLISLSNQTETGKAIGNDCFKIRLAISSKNKGKSGGARVITYVKLVDDEIYLIAIYDKSEADNISDQEILIRIKDL